MKKNLINTLIKILSLGIGLAIGLVLLAKVCFELSYDKFYDKPEQIYEIRTGIDQNGDSKDFYNISGGVAPGFQEEVPGVSVATRFSGIFESRRYIDTERRIIEADYDIIAADTNFFKVFNREFLIGNPVKALSSWNGEVFVSRSFAEKLGGLEEAIGKTISNEELPQLQCLVTGVFEDFPANSTVQADVVTAIQAISQQGSVNWYGNDRYHGYVRLEDNVDPESLSNAIRKMQEAHQPLEELERNGTKIWYYLSAFEGSHIRKENVRNSIVTLSIIAFLLIMISVLNYLLVSLSDIIHRSKELGIRKCYGAGSGSIYGLLVREGLVNMGISLILAAGIIYTFHPTIESLTAVSLKAMMIPRTLILVAVVLALIFIATTVIPSRILVKIPISSAFRGYKETKRKWKLALLSFQFTINIFLFIMLAISSAQYREQTNQDVGYNPENIVYASLRGVETSSKSAIMDKLGTMPFVKAVGYSYQLPIDYCSGNNVYLPGDNRELFNVSDSYESTAGFMELMEFRMLEGTEPKTPKDVAVSRSFVEKMSQFTDWSDGAIGKEIRLTEHSQNENDCFVICGVFEDYRIGGDTNPDTRPNVRFCADLETGYMPILTLRLNDVSAENIDAISSVIDEFVNDIDVEPKIYKDGFNSIFDSTRKMKNTMLIGTVIALLIAFFGLIGFINDETSRRSSEIAIRKVNGACSQEIVSMFVKDIMKLAPIAAIAGDVAAWFVATEWLKQFAEQISLNAWYFIICDILVFMVIIVTVTVGSLRVARTNPTESLKKD